MEQEKPCDADHSMPITLSDHCRTDKFREAPPPPSEGGVARMRRGGESSLYGSAMPIVRAAMRLAEREPARLSAWLASGATGLDHDGIELPRCFPRATS